MDPGFFIALIVIAGVISALGSLVWWVFVVLLARKALSSAHTDIDQLFAGLAQQIRTVSSLPQGNRVAHQPEIAAMMLRANAQMRQLQSLDRQRYETRMGDLMGQAADAGISWTPPAY
jgi:hypothetical protein